MEKRKKHFVIGVVIFSLVLFAIVGYMDSEGDDDSNNTKNNGAIVETDGYTRGAYFYNINVQQFWDDFYSFADLPRQFEVGRNDVTDNGEVTWNYGTVSCGALYRNSHVEGLKLKLKIKANIQDKNELFMNFRYGTAMLVAANGETGHEAQEKALAIAYYLFEKIWLGDEKSNGSIPYYGNAALYLECPENTDFTKEWDMEWKIFAISKEESERKLNGDKLYVNFNDKKMMDLALEQIGNVRNEIENRE